MAIRIEQTGLASLYGQLATLAGQAEAGRRTQQLALETAERARSREHELATMQMRAEYEIEGERRSHEWELEKAEIASRNDFVEEERKRLTKHQEYDAAMKAIDKADYLSPVEREKFKLQLEVKERTGVMPEERVMFPETYARQPSQMQPITELDKLSQFIDSFAENKDMTPGLFRRATKVPLAVVDQKGKPIREATPEERKGYQWARQQMANLTGAGETTTAPTNIPTSTSPTPEELRKIGTRAAYEQGKTLGYWN